AKRAASKMSLRNARSLELKRHRTRQDRSSAVRVPASFDRFRLAQINRPAENLGKLVFHIHDVEERPARIVGEPNHHIHIALRPEVVAYDAAKESERRYLPFLTEVAELLLVIVDRNVGHGDFSLCRYAI